MLKRFLVPTDGSSYSEAAFDSAIHLATAFGSGLVCGLYVIDVKMLAGPFLHDLGVSIGLGPFDTYQPKVRKMLQEKGEEALRYGERRCLEQGIEYEGHLVEGIISREILLRAAKCDMVVMGRLGEHAPWRSGLLGHSVETVTRSARHPVLVTPQTFQKPTRALLAYDGSSHAYDAMHVAGEIALKLGLPLVVVSADPVMAEAERLVAAAARYLSRYQVQVQTVPSTAHAEKAILDAVKEHACDLVVMGAYGHSRIREFIIGSTTEHVMRQLVCPVLLHR